MLDQPQWLERTEFASVSDRLKNRVMLDELISAETQKYTVAQLLRKLLEAKLPAGELNTVEQVVHHPPFPTGASDICGGGAPQAGPGYGDKSPHPHVGNAA